MNFLRTLSRRINFNRFNRRYHEKVMDYYENPRNVGSLDKNDPRVGTGLVGAPACIHEDTLISLVDCRRCVKDLYQENQIIQVWSFSINKNIFEIKNARIIKQHKKPMIKITLDDDSSFICTSDHKLLTRNKTYIESSKCKELIQYYSSNKYDSTNKDLIEESPINKDIKIKKSEQLDGLYDCYDLQVEENNNFAIITKLTKNIQSGIVLKNCGDVMKIQIKVNDEGIIEDAKFKTFGCGSAIASSSLSTEMIKGMHIDEANKIKNTDIAKELSLPPVKLHCSMLAKDAINSAIKNLQEKQSKK